MSRISCPIYPQIPQRIMDRRAIRTEMQVELGNLFFENYSFNFNEVPQTEVGCIHTLYIFILQANMDNQLVKILAS